MKKLPAVAFIGLGRMGFPMAARLVAAGYALQVHDKSGEGWAAKRFAAGPCATAGQRI